MLALAWFTLLVVRTSFQSGSSLVIYHTGDNALPWPELPAGNGDMTLPDSY